MEKMLKDQFENDINKKLEQLEKEKGSKLTPEEKHAIFKKIEVNIEESLDEVMIEYRKIETIKNRLECKLKILNNMNKPCKL